ncbi:MAG: hypothetical protein AAF801_01965 [Pseudomonadota bacterium]
MSKTPDGPNKNLRDDHLHVPTKAEVLAMLQNDCSRGGLQLEWVLDRCAIREGSA